MGTVGDGWAEEADWAINEFGGALLGDQRRTACLVRLSSVLARRPHLSLPEAIGDPAQLKATYRFFENEAIEPAAIVGSHVAATLERVHEAPVVLAVQDSTQVDWTAHPATRGLGQIGNGKGRGISLHSTLALTPARVPLGLLAQTDWVRPLDAPRAPERRRLPVGEKESRKWVESLEAVIAAQDACPQTHFISVGDREADMYELFAFSRPAGVDLVVRSCHDRCLVDADKKRQHLRAALAATPVRTTVEVAVPRHAEQPARTARLGVHWGPITLQPAKRPGLTSPEPIALGAVWAVEETPPPDVPPLDWCLLTTLPLPTTQAALTCLDYYAARWAIEVYHKVLKSGCALEQRQLEDLDHLQRCRAVFGVIAWYVLFAIMAARTQPDLPCTLLLEEAEWQALYCHIHHSLTLPATPPTLAHAVRWIAQLGGFLGRKSDGQPGVTVLWRGFPHLFDLAAMYRLHHPPLRPRKCG
jgi:hypothetical protein